MCGAIAVGGGAGWGGVRKEKNKDAAAAARVGMLPVHVAPCFLVVYLGSSEYEIPAGM